MANWRRATRRAARRAGINPTLFGRQINQESGYNPRAVSPAGARGIAQIMPATARGWGVNPDRPRQALNAAAKHMAEYLHAYHGSWAKALTAYNAGPGAVGGSLPGETRNYISTILGGKSDVKNTGGGGQMTGRSWSVKTGQRSTFDAAGFERARKLSIVGSLIASHHGTDSPLFKLGLLTTEAPDPAAFASTVDTSKIVKGKRVPLGPEGALGKTTVRLASGADRAGVKTSHYLRRVLSGVQGIPGGITITTGSNHNQMTVNGNVSDHWTGHAADIAVPDDSARGDLIAGRVLLRLGVPRKQARKMAQQGGLFNVNYRGKRWQVIWKTNEGGNHHNHVHVGVAG